MRMWRGRGGNLGNTRKVPRGVTGNTRYCTYNFLGNKPLFVCLYLPVCLSASLPIWFPVIKTSLLTIELLQAPERLAKFVSGISQSSLSRLQLLRPGDQHPERAYHPDSPFAPSNNVRVESVLAGIGRYWQILVLLGVALPSSPSTCANSHANDHCQFASLQSVTLR